MKLTGHKTKAVYRRYAIVSSEDLREAVRRLESADGYHFRLHAAHQWASQQADRAENLGKSNTEGWPSGRWRWS
jgi:hypothetical protein